MKNVNEGQEKWRENSDKGTGKNSQIQLVRTGFQAQFILR